MIMEAATQLNHAIKESQEYSVYIKAKKALCGNPELYQAVNAFRRRNYELQTCQDGLNHYEEIRNLSNEYGKALCDPLANDFLKAEQLLSRKMAQAYEVVAQGLELDYDYME